MDIIYLHTNITMDGKQYFPKLAIDLRVVTNEHADATPVGEAQEAPNMEPTLPAPTGRLSLWNPLQLLGGLCSPAFQRKLACLICCLILVALGVYFLPTLATNLLSLLMAEAWKASVDGAKDAAEE